jgi:hypothetical protein
MRKQITAKTVTTILKKLGQSHINEIQERLQVQTYEERQKVRQVLVDLIKAGRVEYHGEELYLLTGKPDRGGVQAKLWEFACLRFATAKPFSVAEAARLAECDRDYTKRYCHWLWNSGYLAIVSRGRAGAILYQVLGGKERCGAPAWNRRAEKRKKKPEDHRLEAGATAPPAAIPKTILRSALEAGYRKEKLDAALEEFGRALMEVAGGIDRAWEIIRQMKGELLALAMEEQGHGEPAEGDHQL